MKFEDMLKFSLGFMPNNPRVLTFFIPSFLLNIIWPVAAYFLFGDLLGDDEALMTLVGNSMISEPMWHIFSIPQIQELLVFSFVMTIMSFIFTFYATICVYRAVKLAYENKKWGVGGVMSESVNILPRYIGLSLVEWILILIPALIGGVLISLAPLFLGILGFIVSLILSILLIIPLAILTVYIALKLFFAPVFLVIENKGIIESLKESWSMTKGNLLYILGYVIIFGVILSVVLISIILVNMIISFVESLVLPFTPISSILEWIMNFYTIATATVFGYLIYLSIIKKKVVGNLPAND